MANPRRETSKEKLGREENVVGNGFVIAGVIVLIIIAALAYYYFHYARNVADTTKSNVSVPEVSTGAIDFSKTNTNNTNTTSTTKPENKTNR